MIEAKAIFKYRNKSILELIDIAERYFHKFIRERDRDGDYFFCPTHNNGAGKMIKIEGQIYQACHLFPAGHYSWLKFNPDNVFGGCKSCNYYKHGVGHEYADWVRKKIGEERFEKLKRLNDYYKQNQYHWDRFFLIETILTYSSLLKLKA